MPGRDTPGSLRIGCCGFPLSLRRYAEEFSVVEVQQTFYQPPALRTLEKWRGSVGDEFEFTLKVWQLITHEATSPTYRRLGEELSPEQRREAGAFRQNAIVAYAWRRTLECARALGSRCILFQCPARFGPTPANRENLRAFFRHIKPDLVSAEAGPLWCVWEPRGAWQAEEVRELCEELGLVHGVDPFQQSPTAGSFGYFRLHGRSGYRYRYTDQELEQLRAMVGKHTLCYVLFNNISMLEDARRFQRLAPSG
jgi:uncharacterized protein YecE (DUF72 family)